MMRITILFGGTNKERLVSVASAQALHQALPEADLWFWDVADTVHDVPSQKLLNHARPFEDEFPSPGPARHRRISPSTRWRRSALRRLRA
jgi:D-alanine-D-alanine ligase